jgi:hypothetical protein
MKPLLPLTARKYITLEELGQEVGRREFPKQWVEHDLYVPSLPTYDAARQADEEAERWRNKLRRMGYKKVDDESITKMLALNELTGSLYHDAQFRPDPYTGETALGLMECLEHHAEKLRGWPPLSEKETYEAEWKRWQRVVAITKKILEGFQNGLLIASYRGSDGRKKAEPDSWKSIWVELQLATNEAVIGDRENIDEIEVEKQSAANFFQVLYRVSPALRHEHEEEARRLLCAMMNNPEAKRLSKEESRKIILRTIPSLKGRAFDRAWEQACKDTKSNWDKPGRPKLV